MVLECITKTRAVPRTIAHRLGEEFVGHMVENRVAGFPTGGRRCRSLIVGGYPNTHQTKL